MSAQERQTEENEWLKTNKHQTLVGVGFLLILCSIFRVLIGAFIWLKSREWLEISVFDAMNKILGLHSLEGLKKIVWWVLELDLGLVTFLPGVVIFIIGMYRQKPPDESK